MDMNCLAYQIVYSGSVLLVLNDRHPPGPPRWSSIRAAPKIPRPSFFSMVFSQHVRFCGTSLLSSNGTWQMAFGGPMPEGVGEKDMLSKAWGWFKTYRTIQHPVIKQQLFLCYLSVPQGTRVVTQADIAGQASFEWTPARFHPTGAKAQDKRLCASSNVCRS